jgi:hypothetical protein
VKEQGIGGTNGKKKKFTTICPDIGLKQIGANKKSKTFGPKLANN